MTQDLVLRNFSPATRWRALRGSGYPVRLMSDVTALLSALGQGDPHASRRLLPLVYDELRRLAAQWMAQEQPGQTLPPAAVGDGAGRLQGPRRGVHFFFLEGMSYTKCCASLDMATVCVSGVVLMSLYSGGTTWMSVPPVRVLVSMIPCLFMFALSYS
jgi:hypothetical protein